MIAQYHAGILSIAEYMRTTLAPLMGRATLTVAGWLRRFIQRVYPDGREHINWHLQRGDTVLITASGEHLALPVAQQPGIHGALAIGVEVVDDRYSGQIYGTAVYSKGKMVRLSDWQARSRISVLITPGPTVIPSTMYRACACRSRLDD